MQQFASPGWPIRYPRNQNCTWILRAAQGYVVHLSATVQLEGPDQEDGTCRYDRIAFSLGNLLKNHLMATITVSCVEPVLSQSSWLLSFVHVNPFRVSILEKRFSLPPANTVAGK